MAMIYTQQHVNGTRYVCDTVAECWEMYRHVNGNGGKIDAKYAANDLAARGYMSGTDAKGKAVTIKLFQFPAGSVAATMLNRK